MSCIFPGSTSLIPVVYGGWGELFGSIAHDGALWKMFFRIYWSCYILCWWWYAFWLDLDVALLSTCDLLDCIINFTQFFSKENYVYNQVSCFIDVKWCWVCVLLFSVNVLKVTQLGLLRFSLFLPLSFVLFHAYLCPIDRCIIIRSSYFWLLNGSLRSFWLLWHHYWYFLQLYLFWLELLGSKSLCGLCRNSFLKCVILILWFPGFISSVYYFAHRVIAWTRCNDWPAYGYNMMD